MSSTGISKRRPNVRSASTHTREAMLVIHAEKLRSASKCRRARKARVIVSCVASSAIHARGRRREQTCRTSGKYFSYSQVAAASSPAPNQSRTALESVNPHGASAWFPNVRTEIISVENLAGLPVGFFWKTQPPRVSRIRLNAHRTSLPETARHVETAGRLQPGWLERCRHCQPGRRGTGTRCEEDDGKKVCFHKRVPTFAHDC